MSETFRHIKAFPNPKDSFDFLPKGIDQIKKDCVFVLDANSLLTPFTTGTKSLNAIKALYENLIKDNRLFIPAHAAREFLANRPQKLIDLYSSLSNKYSHTYPYIDSFPLLEEIKEYQTLLKTQKELKALIEKYKLELDNVIKVVSSLSWDDPVSKMYHTLLKQVILDDSHLDYSSLSAEVKKRNELQIPPGFKDKGKEINSEGDLIIWFELLNLGRTKKTDLIFVSGDIKNDWWHVGNNKPLYTRIELVDEYRIASGGKTFQLVTLSKLLELFDAPTEIISEIKQFEIKDDDREKISRGTFFYHHGKQKYSIGYERAYFEGEIIFSLQIPNALQLNYNVESFILLRFEMKTKAMIFENEELPTIAYFKANLAEHIFNNGLL